MRVGVAATVTRRRRGAAMVYRPPRMVKAKSPRDLAVSGSGVRMDTDARRAQLLELGIAAFATRTYDEVQIDDLARAAGMSKGLLYHYFPTKRHYYVATVREAARRLLALTEFDPSLPPLERLLEGMRRYLDFAERHARAHVALLRGGVGSDADVNEIIESTRRTLIERLLRGTGEDHPSPELRLSLRGWVAFVEATSLDWLEQRDMDRDALMALWLRVLVSLLPESVRALAGV